MKTKNTITTPYRYSDRIYQIQKRFDIIISNNPLIDSLPALYQDEYDIYLNAVIKLNPSHMGDIYYKGFIVRRIGTNLLKDTNVLKNSITLPILREIERKVQCFPFNESIYVDVIDYSILLDNYRGFYSDKADHIQYGNYKIRCKP